MREDVRNISVICPSCFATLEFNGVCPKCGKNASVTHNPPYALPFREVMGTRYLTGEVLGSGGFGITYIGWDLDQSKKVAVKEFFPKEYAVREQGGTRVNVNSHEHVITFNRWKKAFVEEAKILMRIKHIGGVVKLSDFFECNNTSYIVTDFLDGPSLHAYLNSRGFKLPYDDVLKISRPVLESLAMLHAYGVIHRDISPENILIVENKFVKLIDFGGASLFKRPGSENPFTVRKDGYSPLELYRAMAQGPWTDIYQIGATMYHCLTGRIPPPATERLSKDELIKPSELSDVPQYIEDAIIKALSVMPDARYKDIPSFMYDLRI